MAEKVTIMVLKVDLQCCKCYNKVKKLLCKFPQIRDQIYDNKADTVTIKVVCCDPERLRDKLCYKGGGSIKTIKIKPPPKLPAPEKPKEPEKPKAPEKPKEPEKPKPKEPPALPAAPAPKEPEPCPQLPMAYPTFGCCCTQCYHEIPGGPCYYYGGAPPPPCYGTYSRPVYDSWGGGGYRYCYTKRPSE
ncbi:protein PYRICULARIA ORYZAE RESISTANCE 21-like isoform X2 [Hibiscus syriacus]|uniref:protein PYRICULARIA ORYZAE RESISTANCE 21-like isoform X2 n=1 Tax=Hibiscus syriacus TaxID=106335 RepID=UPI00192065B8|nr:protein PYRICULARIA ORYZAE RESISTANCE 21-like isoform X2 [Hibiscus syriacus]